ncbi:MAG: hypothetical protein ACPIOQ_48475, partial [Promethearchaeia archaeon]
LFRMEECSGRARATRAGEGGHADPRRPDPVPQRMLCGACRRQDLLPQRMPHAQAALWSIMACTEVTRC